MSSMKSPRWESSSSPIGVSSISFLACRALGGNIPHAIYADVDSEDLDGRADHLEKVFAALHVYLTAIIADTAHNVPAGALDRRYFDNLLRDLSADALGVMMLRRKCASTKIGGRHDPPVRDRTDLPQTP